MSAASWLSEAACAGKPVEWFFPRHGGQESTLRGRALCAVCPVVAECAAEHRRAERETGMALPGLWAGTTSLDRRVRPRIDARRATPGECVVCGAPLVDRGYGQRPRFCSGTGCHGRAAYRRRRGAPESDAAYEAWRAQVGCRSEPCGDETVAS